MVSLVGTWRLIDARAFADDGKELQPPLGLHPIGIITYEARRMIVSVARMDDLAGPVPQIFSGYAGEYEFDGEMLTVKVVAASSPEGVVDQVRRIVFEGPDRYVATPMMRVLGYDGGLRLTWQRVA